MDILEMLNQFAVDARLWMLLGLIVTDVFFGVFDALRNKKFELKKLADFYQSMVIPYVGGYLISYIISNYLPGGGLDGVLGFSLTTVMWATAVTSLVGSIRNHLKNISVKVEEMKVEEIEG